MADSPQNKNLRELAREAGRELERVEVPVEGAVCATSGVRPDRSAIEAVLPAFHGTLSQVPPRYSAIKVAGERAYDLARDGQEPDLQPRDVEVYSLVLAGMPDADTAEFVAECGKGTYIRSLARA